MTPERLLELARDVELAVRREKAHHDALARHPEEAAAYERRARRRWLERTAAELQRHTEPTEEAA
jgi:hypothetical protein